jgi:hypothetical protein
MDIDKPRIENPPKELAFRKAFWDKCRSKKLMWDADEEKLKLTLNDITK